MAANFFFMVWVLSPAELNTASLKRTRLISLQSVYHRSAWKAPDFQGLEKSVRIFPRPENFPQILPSRLGMWRAYLFQSLEKAAVRVSNPWKMRFSATL
ncbi:MAG: hypothetical protein NTY53_03390 [Kiritimatiellaeota bacterium]|nr:hypothetical protein [Kiritimatiellota bacterium]